MLGNIHTGGSRPWPFTNNKLLLTFFRNMDIQDRKSCTVLTYVSQIKSLMKDELLRIILEHRTQSGEISFFS